MRGKLILVITVLGLLGAAPQVAAAETLYAAPNPGSDSDCSTAKPCALLTAVNQADSGDTVIVGAGTYSPAESYSGEGKTLTIKAAVIGTGRPVVEGTFQLFGSASRISDLQIRNEDPFHPALDLATGAGADRLLVFSLRSDACFLRGSGATITNSVCSYTGPDSFSGMSSRGQITGAMVARNVTTSGNFGFAASAGQSDDEEALTMTNSIATTTQATPQGRDMWFFQGLTTVRYSAFSTVGYYSGDWVSTNQLTEAPVFGSGTDFQEATTSPTIDAGSDAEASGDLDLNGNLRKIGASTDMGAYEYVPNPPVAAGAPATDITSTSATVNGTIDTRSGLTSYHLEYGPTEAHGSSTPEQILPPGAAPSAVRFNLDGLTRETTVNYSIVATNEAGTAKSPNASFATAATKPPDPPLARTAGKVTLSCKRVKVAKKQRVRCKFSQSKPASGRTKLTLKRVRSKPRATGSAKLSASGKAVITLKLSRKGRHQATIVTPTPAGTSQTIHRTVTVR